MDSHQDGLLGHNSTQDNSARDSSTQDSLEAGIASIFAAIQAGGFDEDGEDEAASLGDIATADALLYELNRLWSSPAP